jgi:hypothetical protein
VGTVAGRRSVQFAPNPNAGTGGREEGHAAEGAVCPVTAPDQAPEERREPLINNLLRARPTLTCEKAAEQIDAVFKGALTP